MCSYKLCFYMKDGDGFWKPIFVPWLNCSVIAGRESGEKVSWMMLLGEILLMLLYFQRNIEKLKTPKKVVSITVFDQIREV